MLMTFFNFLLTIFFNKFRTRIRIRQFSLDPDGSGSATLLKRMKKLYITTFLAALYLAFFHWAAVNELAIGFFTR